MKYAVLALFLIFAVGVSYAAANCDVFSSDKTACEFNSCYWCERCSNNEGNTFGQDKCVDTPGSCIYGPSLLCGSQCETNADCKLNLTDYVCMYDGVCSAGSCNYQAANCPQNGTISNGVCHYGIRECSNSGCSISSCSLGTGNVCDPAEGCVTCGKEDCGTNGDYYRNYECREDDVYAERVTYLCNATGCLFSRSDALVQECTADCFEGECLEPKCNFKGIIKDCNNYDAFFDDAFCIGRDIYRNYHDYRCGVDDCEYDTINKLIQSCPIACDSGRCTDTITVINGNATLPTGTTQTNESHGQVARAYSDNVYNGWLFGKNDLVIETEGNSGTLTFSILDANRISSLDVTTGGRNIFHGKPEKGKSYTVYFENVGSSIIFSAETSGWIFFVPNSYHISKAYVIYG